jgi:hypothetical protein
MNQKVTRGDGDGDREKSALEACGERSRAIGGSRNRLLPVQVMGERNRKWLSTPPVIPLTVSTTLGAWPWKHCLLFPAYAHHIGHSPSSTGIILRVRRRIQQLAVTSISFSARENRSCAKGFFAPMRGML